MVFNYKEFEERIIKSLSDSGLIDNFSFDEIGKSPDLSIIINLFENPSVIFFDELGLFYYDELNDKVYCPNVLTSISDQGDWLSDKLPSIGFDIDQNGNVRKASEAEALYCCLQVAHIIKDEVFKIELEDVAKAYNFVDMKSLNDTLSFRELLNSWQNLQSVIINIIISASKFRISNEKKSSEKYLKDGIKESEVAELRDLESKIKLINFKYTEGDLSFNEIKKLTKIERLIRIDKRDDEISSVISKSPVSLLYKALNLTSEYISPIKKKKIALWVQVEVDKLIKSGEFDNVREERSALISQFVKRAYKFEKISLRRLAVNNYISLGSDFKLPSKL